MGGATVSSWRRTGSDIIRSEDLFLSQTKYRQMRHMPSLTSPFSRMEVVSCVSFLIFAFLLSFALQSSERRGEETGPCTFGVFIFTAL